MQRKIILTMLRKSNAEEPLQVGEEALVLD